MSLLNLFCSTSQPVLQDDESLIVCNLSCLACNCMLCIFQGEIKDIVHGVPWRLCDDLALIAHNKDVVPLCQFLRKLAIDNGLSEVNVPDHQVKPRMVEASQPAHCVIISIRSKQVDGKFGFLFDLMAMVNIGISKKFV